MTTITPRFSVKRSFISQVNIFLPALVGICPAYLLVASIQYEGLNLRQIFLVLIIGVLVWTSVSWSRKLRIELTDETLAVPLPVFGWGIMANFNQRNRINIEDIDSLIFAPVSYFQENVEKYPEVRGAIDARRSLRSPGDQFTRNRNVTEKLSDPLLLIEAKEGKPPLVVGLRPFSKKSLRELADLLKTKGVKSDVHEGVL